MRLTYLLTSTSMAKSYSQEIVQSRQRRRCVNISNEVLSACKYEDMDLCSMLDAIKGVTKGKLPENKKAAQILFGLIMKKYADCTEKEKRVIARSDEEFFEM